MFRVMLHALVPSAPPPPSPPSAPGGCVPGRDGVPDSIVGEVLCGTWGGNLSDGATGAAWHLVRDRWPLLLLTVVALIGLRLGWAAWRRRVACSSRATCTPSSVT